VINEGFYEFAQERSSLHKNKYAGHSSASADESTSVVGISCIIPKVQ
jgi:hypothetical protein